jgi:glucose-1-phosphate thymidylyltransferase
MKGVLLAGGKGSRLHPITLAVNKHLLPVFDKPLIHYPIATLMLAGIRQIAVVSSQAHSSQVARVIGDGEQFGVSFTMLVQDEPRGIADGLTVAADFLAGSGCALVLGDNIFYGPGLGSALSRIPGDSNAHVFLQTVADPRPYACASLSAGGEIIGLEEKPMVPKSNMVIPGLYWLPDDAVRIAGSLRPSARGEIEVTDLNREFLRQGRLRAHKLPRGSFWIDAGTPDSLLVAANFVRTIQDRQGLKVACLEEIAWRKGWIEDQAFLDLARSTQSENYARALIESTATRSAI